MRKIYGIGETVLDIIFKDGQPQAAKPGGSSLNAAVTLGRLNMDIEFISEYGNDPVGELIDDFLHKNNVGTRFVTRFEEGKSALALAFLDENNNASYTFHKDFPEERLTNIPQKTAKDDIVTFCSIYAITREVRSQLKAFLDIAMANESILLYDPNFREAYLHELDVLKPLILENFSMAHITRASDEDMRLIFGASDSLSAYEQIKDLCPVLIYTTNVRGVFVHTPAGTFQFPVKNIDPVSTIGAGDNFNAGIVYSMIRDNISSDELGELSGNQWEKIIGTAVEFATETCLSWDNYVSEKFANEFIKKEKGN